MQVFLDVTVHLWVCVGPDVSKGHSVLKIKVLGSFETSGHTQLTTECNVPEDLNLQNTAAKTSYISADTAEFS
jgi:hypothetical protein